MVETDARQRLKAKQAKQIRGSGRRLRLGITV